MGENGGGGRGSPARRSDPLGIPHLHSSLTPSQKLSIHVAKFIDSELNRQPYPQLPNTARMVSEVETEYLTF